MDFFTSSDLQRLLYNKFVVVIGDSVVRGMYKDLVFLLQRNRYMEDFRLKKKCEMNFMGDELVEGGMLGRLHNGKDMREVRQFHTDVYLLRYYYITRCYSEYLETVFLDLEQEPKPDIIIMNSCVWDITRYGPCGFEQYKKNIQRLFKRLTKLVKEPSMFLWVSTLPIGSHVRGGFMLEELDFYNDTLRFDVIVSNFYVKQVVEDYGFEMLDLHHHFRDLTHWRQQDGIHWNVYAHRRITQLLLTYVCQYWGVRLPCRNMCLQRTSILDTDHNQNIIRPQYGHHHRSTSCSGNFSHLVAPPQTGTRDVQDTDLRIPNIQVSILGNIPQNTTNASRGLVPIPNFNVNSDHLMHYNQLPRFPVTMETGYNQPQFGPMKNKRRMDRKPYSK